MILFERGVRTGEVAVVGLARSGIAAARLLRREGIAVYASDRGHRPPRSRPAWRGSALRRGHGRSGRARPGADRPGAGRGGVAGRAARRTAGAAAARGSGCRSCRRSRSGRRALPGVRFVGHHRHQRQDHHDGAGRAPAAGSRPSRGGRREHRDAALASSRVRGERPEWLALEVSSFQLHDTPISFPPAVFSPTSRPIISTGTPRWRSTTPTSRASSARRTSGSCWILNADDPGWWPWPRALPGGAGCSA